MSLFVFFISLLIVAQHVSGNHVPIIRSWRLRDVIASCWYEPWLQWGCQDQFAGSASIGSPVVLHSTSEHGVSSITTADAHTSAASSRLNWCPRRFKWTRSVSHERRDLVSAHVPSHFKRSQRTVHHAEFSSSNQPYIHWIMNTQDTQSATCFGTSWVSSSGSPFIC